MRTIHAPADARRMTWERRWASSTSCCSKKTRVSTRALNSHNPGAETIGQLGIGNISEFRSDALVIAPAMLSRTRTLPSGNYLFQGNFYGVNILTSHPGTPRCDFAGVPGGQGECVGVQKPVFMSGRCEWTSGLRYGGFRRSSAAAGRKRKKRPCR